MKNLFKNYIALRCSGILTNKTKDAKASLEVIKTIQTTSNFWLSWYAEYLNNQIKYLRTLRLLPGRFIASTPEQLAIDKIRINDKIVLNDINLPMITPFSAIIDSLLTYLLDNLDKELVYSIFPRYEEGPYEYKLVQLEKNDVVIDAGANIGEFSALAGVRGCKVYAFEPMPNVVEHLRKVSEWNPNITICQYALSDRNAELFFTEHLTDMSASSYVSNQYISNNKSAKKVKVKSITLDTFAEENKLSSIDFIKADIEGAERDMLMGAKRVLKEFAPKIAICTYHLPDDPQILRKLILNANPKYIIEERWKKMYAYIPSS